MALTLPSSLLFSCLIILPSYFNSITCAILSNETDRLALLRFKSKITKDPFGALSSWNDSSHFCQWNGVTCGRKNQRVTILDLQSKKLVGSISPYIGNLSFLKNLYLVDNTFENAIPPEIGHLHRLQNLDLGNNSLVGEIPVNLSSCLSLLTISLDANHLSGRLPMELGSLPKLWAFAAQFNNLVGQIPSSFGNLSSLIYLDLTRNHLSGSIPHTLGQLKSFKSLGIGDNGFTGTIPPSIFNLSLEGFDLGSNQIHGTLPSNLGIIWPNISFFSVAGNNFFGSIPPSLSNASNLETFYIASNNFTGKVPNLEKLHKLQRFGVGNNSLGFGVEGDLSFISSLSNATNLQLLQLTLNNFGGVLPESIGNLSRMLESLGMDDNQIEGEIPDGIGNLKNLQELSFTGNRLFGSIPEVIGNLRELRILYIVQNELTGRIPSSLGNLKQLLELMLSNNKLEGNIPTTLGNCTSLTSLQLDGNHFNGTIPIQLFHISSSVIELNLHGNDLTGPLHMEIGNFINLHTLDVSENRLSSEIPNSIGNCVTMEQLYLKGNSFQGIVPSSLSSLRALRTLDLSHNNLSGEIPNFLKGFVFLENLNLSFNGFAGMVPSEGVFKNASATSVEGNNRLCGGIPEFHLPPCNSNESRNKKRSPTLKIIFSIVLPFLGAAMLISSFLFLRLRKKKSKIASSSLKNPLLQVSYRALYKATDGFSLANLIGKGGFGSVYKGTLDDERVVAVKVFNLHRHGGFKSFLLECEAMKNIRHRNVIKVVTACSSVDAHGDDFKALVYEFMVNGSLEEWLDPMKKMGFVRRLNIAIDVASGLDYLHHQYCQTPIVHCDLKPSNVLLDDEMTARISDFGLVKFVLAGSESTSASQISSVGVRGTIGYAAPEYGMGSEVSTHGDVYSFGILLLEMFSGRRPTDDMFNDSLNLHNYVKTATPERIAEIVEPILLEGTEEEDEIGSDNEGVHMVIKWLALILEIGVACSAEVPRERMGIDVALAKLIGIRNNLVGVGGRGHERASQAAQSH